MNPTSCSCQFPCNSQPFAMTSAPVLPLHSESLRVAIITENFLPKIDGVTITLAHLLEHLKVRGAKAMLLGPESGMAEYAGCRLFGTFGVPLKVYPGLKINFISAAFIRALREFKPDVIHLVDPIWLGVQALAAITILFPGIPVVTSHHTNLPTYATIFGYPYYHHRTWQIHCYLHSFAKYTLVPSASTADLLEQKGFANLRVCHRGVDPLFNPSLRSGALRESWGVKPGDLVVLSVGRLSPEKNLSLVVESFSLLPPSVRERAKLVFVGDGPFRLDLQQLCVAKGVQAIFTGQLTGTALGAAFASADIMSSPSITETFGQVTLQAMASGLPVVGLNAEGTADLVVHRTTGLLLDVHAATDARPGVPLGPVACFRSAAHLMRPTGPAFGAVAARYAQLLAAVLSAPPECRREMGRAALAAARKYPWERCTERILDTYVEARGCAPAPGVGAGPGPGALQVVLDALVVVHALVAATLSHFSYMVPTAADLFGLR
ncbi:hypothetical protein B0H10DRAFT_2067775 [Mycena sp. CBHHK59/15]|nr:hypothetical protein B0H10DRAFT_2067775 [Mycena sp. CBHHK59/15]